MITLNYNLVQVIRLLKWMRIIMVTDSLGTLVTKVKTAMQHTIGRSKNILFRQNKIGPVDHFGPENNMSS